VPQVSKEPEDRADDGRNEVLYQRMMDEAREVSDKAVQRLRDLGGALPSGTVEQVERLHRDPLGERRKVARLSDPPLPVSVRATDLPPVGGSALRNHSPLGLAVLLPCPAGEGTLLRVRLPPDLGVGWVTVEVKYCRREEGGWLAGCELLAEQAPL